MKNRIRLDVRRRWRTWNYILITLPMGGVGYGLLEVMWRGYTHPSMILTGGFCFMAILYLNQILRKKPLLFRCLLCTALVTVTEFFVGILVNRILHLHVWDYSASRFNLLGQICLEFSFVWFLICTAISLSLQFAFRKDQL